MQTSIFAFAKKCSKRKKIEYGIYENIHTIKREMISQEMQELVVIDSHAGVRDAYIKSPNMQLGEFGRVRYIGRNRGKD